MASRVFFAIFLGSLLALFVNIALSAVAVYFAASFLGLKENSAFRALLVVLAGLAIGIAQDVFFPATFLFSWILALLLFLYMVRSIYRVEWMQAALLWFFSIVLSLIIALVFAPILVAAILSLPGL